MEQNRERSATGADELLNRETLIEGLGKIKEKIDLNVKPAPDVQQKLIDNIADAIEAYIEPLAVAYINHKHYVTIEALATDTATNIPDKSNT